MKKIITGFSLLFFMFLLLLFPEQVKAGSLDGLFLWYNSVVPILLPFLILSNIIIATDSLSPFLNPLFSIQKKHKRFQPLLLYPVFLGLFCGFPMGAKTIADLIRSEKMSIRQGNLLLPVVNQASPMFLAGFVGVHILNKQLSLFQILYYLYLPAFFSLILRLLFSKEDRTVNSRSASSVLPENKNSMSLNLEHTIWNSFYVIVIIGIYMMLFSVASRLCMELLPKNNEVSILLCSLEFSNGLNQLSKLTFLNPVTKTGLLLALTSFGGFCTAAQTSTLVKETGVSMKSYLFWKFLIALFVFFLYSSSNSSS